MLRSSDKELSSTGRFLSEARAELMSSCSGGDRGEGGSRRSGEKRANGTRDSLRLLFDDAGCWKSRFKKWQRMSKTASATSCPTSCPVGCPLSPLRHLQAFFVLCHHPPSPSGGRCSLHVREQTGPPLYGVLCPDWRKGSRDSRNCLTEQTHWNIEHL